MQYGGSIHAAVLHPFSVAVSFSQVSAINELCCPGGHALARSIAQRTRKAAKDAAKVPALCYGPS